jgi:hypothetical protein
MYQTSALNQLLQNHQCLFCDETLMSTPNILAISSSKPSGSRIEAKSVNRDSILSVLHASNIRLETSSISGIYWMLGDDEKFVTNVAAWQENFIKNEYITLTCSNTNTLGLAHLICFISAAINTIENPSNIKSDIKSLFSNTTRNIAISSKNGNPISHYTIINYFSYCETVRIRTEGTALITRQPSPTFSARSTPAQDECQCGNFWKNACLCFWGIAIPPLGVCIICYRRRSVKRHRLDTYNPFVSGTNKDPLGGDPVL